MDEESGKVRTWTLPRLQNAVKAAFFSEGVELGKSESEIALRYSDLKRSVGKSEGPVADRTLSRALADLVAKGHLTREPKGREVYYRLTIPIAERVGAFAKSDADAIRSAAQVGGIADLEEGWAYYGVPDAFKSNLRGSLRRAGMAYRRSIDEILDRAVDTTIRAVVRRGRGKFPREVLWKVEDALYAILERSAVGWLVAVRGRLMWSNIETMIPGALLATQRAMGIERLVRLDAVGVDSLAELLSKVLRVPFDELRDPLEREFKRIARYQSVLDQFFGALSPEERDTAGRELTGLITLVANLTAVVRA